jgi:hypothetical protein
VLGTVTAIVGVELLSVSSAVGARSGVMAFAVGCVIPATALARYFRVGTVAGFLFVAVRQIPAAFLFTDLLRVSRAPCSSRRTELLQVSRAPCSVHLEVSLSFGCIVFHAEVLTRAALPLRGEKGTGMLCRKPVNLA